MGPTTKRSRRERTASRRRRDLFLGGLVLAALAAPLLDRRPPTPASWWLAAWLAGLGVFVGVSLRARRDAAGRTAADARLLLAAAAAIHVLAVFRGLGVSALLPGEILDAIFPPGGASPWLAAYAVPILAAAAWVPWRWAAPALWGVAVLLEAAHLLLRRAPAPGVPADAAATAVTLGILGALCPLVATFFRQGDRKRRELQKAIDEHNRFRSEAEEYHALSEHRRAPEMEDLSPESRRKRLMGLAADHGQDRGRVLALARRAIGARTVFLLLRGEDGEHLVLRGAAQDEEGGPPVDRDARVRLGDGLIGTAAQARRSALFSGLEPGSLQPPLYTDGTASPSLLVAPVELDAVTCGVLVADAAEAGAFDRRHEQLLEGFAGEIRELLEDAREDAQRERRSHRHDALLFALAQLSRTIKLDEVTERMVELTREIVEYERCAVFLMDPDGRHLVLAARRGFEVGEQEVRISRESHLPGYIAGSGRPLLYSNLRAMGRAVTIVPGAPGQQEIRSLLGLPLTHAKEVVGVWVLASDEPDRFTAAHLDLLRAIADQATILILNARLHREVESRAVTDGLTGLFNHRTFQERLGQEIERRDRTGQPLSLLLLDIDHFKRINDAHGHPFGDQVIRTLAGELSRLARRADTVARYGGEEFALILVNTDRRGAAVAARRVLKAVRALQIPREEGPFGFTVSVGAATSPDDALTREELVGAADRALYAAKAEGRDRAKAVRELG